jgi:hypothetical protein
MTDAHREKSGSYLHTAAKNKLPVCHIDIMKKEYQTIPFMQEDRNMEERQEKQTEMLV